MSDLASQKIDDADFQRQLAAARDVSVVEELREFITGDRAAKDVMRIAKENALRKARKAMVRQIEAANDRMRDRRLFPVATDQNVRSWIENEGTVKVEA